MYRSLRNSIKKDYTKTANGVPTQSVVLTGIRKHQERCRFENGWHVTLCDPVVCEFRVAVMLSCC